MGKHLWCLGALVLLSGCATPTLQTPQGQSAAVAQEADNQRKYVLQKMVDQHLQVERVLYKLETGAVDLCGARVGGNLGMDIGSGKGLPQDYKTIALNDFGLDDGATLIAVADDGPAARAGLMVGDHLISVGDTLMAPDQRTTKAIHKAVNDAAMTASPVLIRVKRGGLTIDRPIVPARGCDFPPTIVNDAAVNAFADDNGIFINTGLLDFVHSDVELATVLSHEMSHDILGHNKKTMKNEVVGGALGFAADVLFAATTGVNPGFTRTGMQAGANAYSVQFEQEADYEGVYLLQHAGYKLDDVPNIWRRLAVQVPETITVRTDHPTSPERFVALTNAVAEIKAKEAAGEPLVPNLKPVDESAPAKPAAKSAP